MKRRRQAEEMPCAFLRIMIYKPLNRKQLFRLRFVLDTPFPHPYYAARKF
jgi:hypothetical protein